MKKRKATPRQESSLITSRSEHCTKSLSMRSAIDGMCKNCLYDKLQPGTWRQQIEACTSTQCPLYNLRPTPITVKIGPNRANPETTSNDTRLPCGVVPPPATKSALAVNLTHISDLNGSLGGAP